MLLVLHVRADGRVSEPARRVARSQRAVVSQGVQYRHEQEAHRARLLPYVLLDRHGVFPGLSLNRRLSPPAKRRVDALASGCLSSVPVVNPATLSNHELRRGYEHRAIVASRVVVDPEPAFW